MRSDPLPFWLAGMAPCERSLTAWVAGFQTMKLATAYLMLLLAAVLEGGDDALVRAGLHHRAPAARLGLSRPVGRSSWPMVFR
jgi:hypothetical protein